MLEKLTGEQTEAFNKINQSVIDTDGQCYFLNGAGGCGKTTVAKTLIHAARSRGQIVIACASSGIAATLLPRGQTAHSAFQIPIENLSPESSCQIGGRSGKAELMRRVTLIIWDEAFMIHRYGFEAVARMLRKLRNNETLTFGGVVVVIMGDLRQTLPVLPRASRVQIIRSCLTRSKIWKCFQRIALDTNMRVMSVQSDGDRERFDKYCKFLIQLGDGDLPLDKKGAIRIPEEYLLPCNDPNGLFDWTYDDRPDPLPDKTTCSADEYIRSLNENIDYYSDKAILCPKNVDVDKMNEEMMKLLATRTTRMLSKCR